MHWLLSLCYCCHASSESYSAVTPGRPSSEPPLRRRICRR
ncbi:hypothetical protein I553_8124 [Mycobacterium xenopi 4042]|uniref:Uncharacterized protein n=1 Tax=Mycobacterium xenopi 4042 TaxID=1299334 RepID=X8DAC4_MYCXE|nr:hypothetical protein I553_8124 [Mycobacterium xenopi 4042]